MSFNEDMIVALNPKTIFDQNIYFNILEEPPEEQERLKALLILKAKELGVQKEFQKVLKAYINADKALADQYAREYAQQNCKIQLDFDSTGKPSLKQSNFTKIFQGDDVFSNVVYNQLTNSPGKMVDGKFQRWTDVDDAEMREYIEDKYKIYSYIKCSDAFLSYSKSRSFHPIKQEIEKVKWDGTSRIYDFLHKWTKCEDTPYTREVSRLIFAGGIHRLYNPGCKFDDMPVLIGTRQGEGKSTLVRWLALKDEYFTDVSTFQGNAAVENINGAWICEVSELLALTKVREQEEAKAFLTKVKDKYREPYSRRPEDRPRQCIFIGTTNKLGFLTDLTGNRRFYPVIVNCNGYDLFDHKKECQNDIKQCWAEARELFMQGEFFPYADPKLAKEIRKQQDNCTEDDYRIGMIEDYLTDKTEVCILELWQDALKNDYSKPSKKDSNEIALILQKFPNWIRQNNGKRFTRFGYQKYWVNTDKKSDIVDENDIQLIDF